MSKKYRVAVIGRTGRGDYGHDLDKAWQTIPSVELVAVADDDRIGLSNATQRLGVPGFADYRAMLDEVKPDIVGIATRWLDQHHVMMLAAAERGIHIYTEKPFCQTLAQADAVVAACERAHVKLAIAHPTRYSPRLAKVKELLAAGKLGRVLEFRGRGKEDRRGGGEDLWVLGTHIMDMIRALAGAPEWCFAKITQNGRPITKSDVVDGGEGIGPLAGDFVHAVYGLSGGAIATFQSAKSAEGKPSRYGLTILGSRGVIEILEGILPTTKFLADPSWSPGRSGKLWQDITSAGIDRPEPLAGPDYEERHRLAILDLVASIENAERQPIGNMHEARGAMEMIVAAFESQRLGRPVEFPLVTRENPLTLL